MFTKKKVLPFIFFPLKKKLPPYNTFLSFLETEMIKEAAALTFSLFPSFGCIKMYVSV